MIAAVKGNHHTLVKELLKGNANLYDPYCGSLLETAICYLIPTTERLHWEYEIIKLLLRYGMKILKSCDVGVNPLNVISQTDVFRKPGLIKMLWYNCADLSYMLLSLIEDNRTNLVLNLLTTVRSL